jgi:hypothetical protein
MTELQPWERRNGETNRWHQRFDAFRLQGPGRSLLSIYLVEWRKRRELAGKSMTPEPKSVPGSWTAIAKLQDWYVRANAWDQHLVDQKEAVIKAAQAAAEAAWREKIMGPTETLARISDHGRNDVREFFKVSERWTENPAPTEEIIEDEVRTVIRHGEEVDLTFYRVRKIVFDVDALLDPTRSHRVKKFTDSPKNGLGIELYNADDAAELMAKHHKLLTDTVDVNMFAATKGYVGISPDDWDDAEGGDGEDAPTEP